MPELPEVTRVMMSLEPKIVGRKILDARVTLDKIIKQQNVTTFVDRIIDKTILSIERRGKYLITKVTGDNKNYKIITHLGMTGAWLTVKDLNNIDAKFRKHAHVNLILDDGTQLVYCDIRRFGGLRIFNDIEFNNTPIVKLGPEPFWDNAEELFLQNVKKKLYRNKKQEDGTKAKESIVIKEAILDQSILAGVGNIYASEALLEAKILPDTPVVNLTDDQLSKVFKAARDIMTFSITVGGSSISDYIDGEGKSGKMQEYLKAYGQDNCGVCSTPIIKTEVAGRSTFHCPNCQK